MTRYALIEYEGTGYEIPVSEVLNDAEVDSLVSAILPEGSEIKSGAAQ
jgi:hypothetical protein